MDRPIVSRHLVAKVAAILALAGVLLWAAWVSRELAHNKAPTIVTVRLAETIGKFVDEAARADAEPQAVQAASLAYLKAAEAAVAELGGGGRIVLVAEAVLGGDTEDATPELERRIAQKLEQGLRP